MHRTVPPLEPLVSIKELRELPPADLVNALKKLPESSLSVVVNELKFGKILEVLYHSPEPIRSQIFNVLCEEFYAALSALGHYLTNTPNILTSADKELSDKAIALLLCPLRELSTYSTTELSFGIVVLEQIKAKPEIFNEVLRNQKYLELKKSSGDNLTIETLFEMRIAYMRTLLKKNVWLNDDSLKGGKNPHPDLRGIGNLQQNLKNLLNTQENGSRPAVFTPHNPGAPKTPQGPDEPRR